VPEENTELSNPSEIPGTFSPTPLSPAPTRMATIRPNYLYYLARALMDFAPEEENQLRFKKNEILEIYERDTSGWWLGRLNGKCGWVPSDYFILLEENFFDETENENNNNQRPIPDTPPSITRSATVSTHTSVNTTPSSSRSELRPTSMRTRDELNRLFSQIDQEEKKSVSTEELIPDDIKPTMEGYLQKLDTSGVVKQWRKRWFSLHGSRLLYYHEKPTSGQIPPSGMIPVLFATAIEPVSDRKDPKKNKTTFQVILPQKIYFLQAETTDSMIDWVCAMKDMKASYTEGMQTENPRNDVSPLIEQSKTGVLEVLINGRWRKRWYTLKDGVITEQESRNGKVTTKIPLYGCNFDEYKPLEKKFRSCFSISSSGVNQVVLKAESEVEMQNWLSVLKLQKYCIQTTLDSIKT